MQITDTIIRAYAALYSCVELRSMLADATRKLGSGGLITSATTGAGTGYTRTIAMSPEEAIELYQRVIEYKQGRTVPSVRVERFYDPGTAC